MKKEEIFCPECAEAAGPYVQGLKYGQFVFATQIGIDKEGYLAKGGIEAQTKQAMENLKMILETAGSDMKNILKCTIYIADAADKPGMNRIYQSYFSDPFPARCCVQIAGMSDGALVEMEVVAYID